MRQHRCRTTGCYAALLCFGIAGACTHLRAQTNYCPGSPYDCVTWASCQSITWCVDEAGNCDGWAQQNFEYFKYLIIKQCTDYDPPGGGVDTLWCSSCGPTSPNGCCYWLDPENACPETDMCP